ncbi:MAG: aldo/keto reductase, partial [Ramlibacter sp.]|nr:aldo/keto reductase [Ramlibacter sp.]
IGELQQSDAERLVGQAIDAGINFIDTADVYAGGVSEQITGQAPRYEALPGSTPAAFRALRMTFLTSNASPGNSVNTP